MALCAYKGERCAVKEQFVSDESINATMEEVKFFE